MKKLFVKVLVFLALVMIATQVSQVQAVNTKGVVLDPIRRSENKDCNYNGKRLFTLTHSAYFTPTSTSACAVSDHKVDAINLKTDVRLVTVQKTTENSGFRAIGKGTTFYAGANRVVTSTLNY